MNENSEKRMVGNTGYEVKHSNWSSRSDAWSDLLCRADAERTGKPYDHTKRYKQKDRDDAR